MTIPFKGRTSLFKWSTCVGSDACSIWASAKNLSQDEDLSASFVTSPSLLLSTNPNTPRSLVNPQIEGRKPMPYARPWTKKCWHSCGRKCLASKFTKPYRSVKRQISASHLFFIRKDGLCTVKDSKSTVRRSLARLRRSTMCFSMEPLLGA